VVAARELQITLTSRNKEKGAAIPMCGVPYHSADNYIAKLIRKGFKVAICEQMEVPSARQETLVKREVTRVLTPGTARQTPLDSEENNFLAAVATRRKCAVGFAALDLSTGEFRATEFVGDDAERRIEEELLSQLRPARCCCTPPRCRSSISREPDGQAAAAPRITSIENASWAETPLDDWVFAPDYAIAAGGKSLRRAVAGRLRPGQPAGAAAAAGAILHYVRTTQRGSLDHVDRIGFYERQNCLVLDAVTVAQSGADRAPLRRLARGRHALSLDRLHGNPHGQAPAARLDAAPLD
jgi:DNA mismatch repair protein MutS